MTTRNEVMTRLKSFKGDLATRYNVRKNGIFGSVARGEDDNQSDMDLLVEFGSRENEIGNATRSACNEGRDVPVWKVHKYA